MRAAHDLLAPVYDWFTEGFDTPDLQEAKSAQFGFDVGAGLFCRWSYPRRSAGALGQVNISAGPPENFVHATNLNNPETFSRRWRGGVLEEGN